MKNNFETKFTGWSFIVAALLLWGGWFLSPHHIGEYIKDSDFSAVNEHLWYWIWMYRIHIFGWVAMAIALFALIGANVNKPSRVLVLPGAGMVVAGTFTLAIAAAFYYNFGAWGVGMTAGKSAVQIQEFMDTILPTNQYVTCFVRFGRVFSGMGLILLGAGFIKWKMLYAWLGWFTVLLGFAAMAIVMGIPDNFEIYKPLFHIKAVWLALMGIIIVSKGIHLPKPTT
jgi:hypothetical protein